MKDSDDDVDNGGSWDIDYLQWSCPNTVKELWSSNPITDREIVLTDGTKVNIEGIRIVSYPAYKTCVYVHHNQITQVLFESPWFEKIISEVVGSPLSWEFYRDVDGYIDPIYFERVLKDCSPDIVEFEVVEDPYDHFTHPDYFDMSYLENVRLEDRGRCEFYENTKDWTPLMKDRLESWNQYHHGIENPVKIDNDEE